MRILFEVAAAALLTIPIFASPLSLPRQLDCSADPTFDVTNVSNWNAVYTDTWLQVWWEQYFAEEKLVPHRWDRDLVNVFGRMYQNGVNNYECQTPDDQCFGALGCDEVKCPEYWIAGCDDAYGGSRPPYFVMRAAQSMQDYFSQYRKALDVTQLNFQGLRTYLVKNFIPPIDTSFEMFLNQLFNALAPVFSISASALKLEAFAVNSVLTKEALGGAGNIANAVGSGFIKFVPIPKNPDFDNMEKLDQFMTNVFDQVRTMLSNMQYNIAIGNQFEGKDFRNFATGGALLPGRRGSASPDGSPTTSPEVVLRETLMKQFNARAINSMWRTQKIFITYTTDVEGSCAEDRQGPQELKYCREGDPGVFYLYWWHQKAAGAGPTIGIDTFDTGKMDYPTGWDKLDAGWVQEGYHLTIQDVMESSIAAYQAAQFDFTAQKGVDEAVKRVTDGVKAPWEATESLAGTFTIPICNTGDVSYNVAAGDRIMPCGCGANGDGSEVDGFKKAANMEGYGVYDDQCTADKQAARKTLRHGGSGGIPVSDHPRLPSEPNEVQCLSDPNSPTSSMISDIDACHNAIYSLGTDMSRQICSSDCSDGGNGQNSVWCRVAWDESKDCALTIAARSPERGGPGYACVSLGDAMNFWNIAQAVPEDGGKGCHPVGTRDFAATFLEPGGSWRLCLSDFGTADYCTL